MPEKVETWVEPFSGGGSTALRLLSDGLIECAVLADRDDLVSGLWLAATTQNAELIEAVQVEAISLERRDYWCSVTPETVLDRAMACLMRNRLSYGGSLVPTVGPTGGREKAGEPGFLEARFQRAAVITRLEAIGSYATAGRLVATEAADWRDTLRLPDLCDAFFYLDPVYLGTDKRTYQHGMTLSDHRDLAKWLLAEDRQWLLSYGDVPEIRSLYKQSGISISRPRVSYAAVGTGDTAREGKEILLSNYPRRRAIRNTSDAVTNLRINELLLERLDPEETRSETIRQLVEQIAEEGLPAEEKSERRTELVAMRIDRATLLAARAEAKRRGMSLAEAVERLLERS